MAVSAIPDGHHTITPYLIVKDAKKALDFYRRAFDATTRNVMESPDGKIGHAEVKIGNSYLMIADEHPEIGAVSAQTLGGSPVAIHLYVEDVDARVQKAIAAGAKLVREVKDQFYGDRLGAIEDEFGYQWYVSTHIEDVSEAEMKRRAAALYGG